MQQNTHITDLTEAKTFCLKIATAVFLLLVVSLLLTMEAGAGQISDTKISMAVDTQLQHDLNIPALFAKNRRHRKVVPLCGIFRRVA